MAIFSFLQRIAQGDSAPGGGVFGFLHESAKQVGKRTSQVGNEFVALPSVLTGDLEKAKKILSPGGGLGGQGGVLGGQEVSNQPIFLGPKAGENIKKTVGTAADLASYVLAPGAGSAAKTLAGKVVSGAAKGGAIGAVGGAGSQLAETGQIDPRQLALSTVTGSVLGGGAPIARQVVKDFRNANEVGAVGRNVNYTDVPLPDGAVFRINSDTLNTIMKSDSPQAVIGALTKEGVTPDIASRIAPALTKTKDPNVIANIIDKNVNPLPSPAPVAGRDVTPVEQPKLAGQGSAQREVLSSLQEAPWMTPEGKQALSELPQTHPVRPTAPIYAEAQKLVDSNPVEATQRVFSGTKQSYDRDVAIGVQLERKAIQEGRHEEAARIADVLATRGTEYGRGVQAYSGIANLSPEGILVYAQRKIGKMRESRPRVLAKETGTAKEIQGQIENPVIDRGTVSGVVKEIANEQQALPLEGVGIRSGAVENTGTKLAKNVEAAALPPKPKQVDLLVQELTKKVKQEYLEPAPTIKKQPVDILREVFGRTKEAQAAYPYAQEILRRKYANVPEMQDALNKFFASEVGLPASSSTINSAIREQLKTSGEKISQIIYKSWSQQKQSVEDIASALTKEGFDPTSAGALAQEVTTRLNRILVETKHSVLESMSKAVKESSQPTYLQKLSKLSNLGALDQQDYLDLARAKLGLPHLDPETAKGLSELAQKIQTLPEGHEKYVAIRQIHDLINQTAPLTKWDIIKGIPGIMRSIVASGDISFGGRQGLAYLASHPIRFAREWPKQFTYFKEAFKGNDSKAFDAMMADIRNHPDYPLLQRVEKELGITEPKGHLAATREEQFIGSDLANKIPGIRRLINGSNYAYTGLGNGLRSGEFYAQLAAARYAGREIDDGLIQGLAKVISNSTGRGNLGRFERIAGELSTGLFAPRLIASRVNMIDPRYYINLPPQARQEAVRQLLGLSAFGVGVLEMANLAGLNVGTNPKSADFGKIRVGDTRIDILGGFSQYIRFGAQFITGEKINSTTGAQTEAGKGFAGSRFDILTNFFENKTAPAPSLVIALAKGEDISGNSIYNPKGIGQQVMQRFVPLLYQDMADLFTHPDSANKVLAGVLGASGAGIQTYGIQDQPVTERQKAYLDIQKANGVPEEQVKATKSFFQFLKVASGKKENTNDAINKAIAEGDIPKAQQLANEYNQGVIEGLKPWGKQNKQYLNEDLLKQVKSSLINLDNQAVKSRVQTILSNPAKYNLPLTAGG